MGDGRVEPDLARSHPVTISLRPDERRVRSKTPAHPAPRKNQKFRAKTTVLKTKSFSVPNSGAEPLP